MKYILISSTKFEDKTNSIYEFMKNVLNVETELKIESDDISYVKTIISSAEQIASANREGIAMITIDETGGLGFATASKVKGMISSQISDEHSSHMTREHNGSVGLNLGGHITDLELMKSIVKLYVEERFAAGRHMVRVDMLDCMG